MLAKPVHQIRCEERHFLATNELLSTTGERIADERGSGRPAREGDRPLTQSALIKPAISAAHGQRSALLTASDQR
jgi:hypothetical protein